jgi:hypothetical protein
MAARGMRFELCTCSLPGGDVRLMPHCGLLHGWDPYRNNFSGLPYKLRGYSCSDGCRSIDDVKV